ncbi:MAG: hypothetical protein MHM6MM_006534, partial [Cercozoa sp. M6MM]
PTTVATVAHRLMRPFLGARFVLMHVQSRCLASAPSCCRFSWPAVSTSCATSPRATTAIRCTRSAFRPTSRLVPRPPPSFRSSKRAGQTRLTLVSSIQT